MLIVCARENEDISRLRNHYGIDGCLGEDWTTFEKLARRQKLV